jgi:hypothetical protein
MKVMAKIGTGILLFVLVACAGRPAPSEGGESYDKHGVKVNVEQKPMGVFTQADIKSVAVVKFDAKAVKSFRGVVIDYIRLSNVFSDDLIKSFYEQSPGVKVAIGEFEKNIIESDELSRQRGDQELRTSKSGRKIVYEASPYKKLDAVITGRINVFRRNRTAFEKSYIHITVKVVSTYDGKVYWISDLAGNYRDVIETIALTINRGRLTYPIPSEAKKEKTPQSKKKQTK